MELFDTMLPAWVRAMQDYYEWYDNAMLRLKEARDKGLSSYKEILADREFEKMLELLRQIPPPKYKEYKNLMKDLEKAIECQIKFREVDLRLLDDPSSRSKAGKAGLWLTASNEFKNKSRKSFDKLFEK